MALAGLRREVQAVVIELCTMAAVAHPLQLLPQALTCLQNGQLQLILQPQARPPSSIRLHPTPQSPQHLKRQSRHVPALHHSSLARSQGCTLNRVGRMQQVVSMPSGGGEAAAAPEAAPPHAAAAGLNPVTCVPGAPAPAPALPPQAELPGPSPSQLTLSQCSLGQYLLSQPALGSQAAPLGSQPLGAATHAYSFLQVLESRGEGASLHKVCIT